MGEFVIFKLEIGHHCVDPPGEQCGSAFLAHYLTLAGPAPEPSPKLSQKAGALLRIPGQLLGETCQGFGDKCSSVPWELREHPLRHVDLKN